jgi:hypothetical protein
MMIFDVIGFTGIRRARSPATASGGEVIFAWLLVTMQKLVILSVLSFKLWRENFTCSTLAGAPCIKHRITF